jgi:heme/copper-type cytochrome/quinol oxidase subunit 2
MRDTKTNDSSSIFIDYLMAAVAIVILVIGSFIYVSVKNDKSTLPTFSPTKITYDKDRDV